ncbi:MAG: DUF885 family protein [Actinomycetes bacterium]
MQPRVRRVLDLTIPSAREEAGRHEYDGVVQDLSPDSVRAGLAALGGEPCDDPHDDAHLAAHEEALRVSLGELQMHRRNPLLHLSNLELACYDRAYAPGPERSAARRQHLTQWPDAIDAAVKALDLVPAPIAVALDGPVRGLAAGLGDPTDPVVERALRAHQRLVEHVRALSVDGDPDVAIGASGLARLMSSAESLPFDVEQWSRHAERERERLWDLLVEGAARIDPTSDVRDVVARLMADQPRPDEVVEQARVVSAEVLAFTREHRLAPTDGELLVDIAPESRRWAVAMMTWAAPGEQEGPSTYAITPPDVSWPRDEQEQWMAMFNRSSLPAITAHEVAPGHYSHGRALRAVRGDVRRTLIGAAFAEGWAHYVEEALIDEGFRDHDPAYAVGVALEALCRVVRLSCAIGLHTATMDVAEATRRFERDALLGHSAARSEAQRGTFDPGYGMYTWGKLEILRQREGARAAWGSQFSLPRFHEALLDLGSPPLGLLGTATDRG